MDDVTVKGISQFFERLSRASGTEIEAINRDRTVKGDVPFIVVDNSRKVVSAADLVNEFEKTQPTPFRRRGTYQAASVESLLAWMTTHTAEVAPVFGVGLEKLNGEWRAPRLSLVGIGNYSAADKAAWHDFNVKFAFPVAFPWMIWAKGHSDEEKPVWFKQEQFAEFIEDRIYDLSSPEPREKLSEAVTRFLEASGKKDAATPAEMFKISRELKLYSDAKVETKIDLQSGEAQLKYSEEHTGPSGRPVKIPALFYIRVPVFFGQEPVLIGVKLRYRAAAGSVAWSYSLFAPDMVVAGEFEKACDAVRKSNRPVYLGLPDGISG